MSDLIRIFSGTIDDGLIGHWSPTLQADSGSVLLDRAGSNDLTLTGATWVADTDVGGEWSVVCNATGEALTGGGSLSRPRTVAWWSNAYLTNRAQSAVRSDDPAVELFSINQQSSVNAMSVYYGGAHHTTSPEYTHPTSTWIHCVWVDTGTSWDLYIDGTYQTGATPSYGPMGDWNSFAIAHSASGTGYSNAKMDSIRIYNRALTALEVTELFDGGRGENFPAGPTFNAAWAQGATAIIQRTI